ncbi:MAG TPA: site-specific integrase [Rubrobacter sp.]
MASRPSPESMGLAPVGWATRVCRALLGVLYAGALRREEAVRLKWRDLKDRDDLGAGVGQATLFGKGAKTGVALLPASVYSQVLGLRKVTESTSTGEMIERYASEDEPVFRSRKRNNRREGNLEVSQVNRIVAKAARDAGIDRAVSLHWLRHAHARKTDLALIRDTLRHSSIATTGRSTCTPVRTTPRRCTWASEVPLPRHPYLPTPATGAPITGVAYPSGVPTRR